MKHITHIILALTIATSYAVPTMAEVTETASEAAAIIEETQDMSQVSVTVSGTTITVQNAEKMTIEIYNLTGDKVYTQRIDSPSKSIDLGNLTHGCYIVRIGKFVRKIYLK